MGIFKLDLKYVLIVLLILVIVFQQCNRNTITTTDIVNIDGTDYELLDHKIDTVYRDTIIIVPKYVPVYSEKLVEVEVIIPMNIDSLAIIKDYFSKYEVKDTLILDGLGKGYLTDIISQNKIESRNIQWDYSVPIITDVKTVKELPKNQIYFGFNTNFDNVNIVNSISAGTILKTKKDRLYQLNVGLSNTTMGQTTPYIGGGLYWKVKLRK
jgi:hypothetical protein